MKIINAISLLILLSINVYGQQIINVDCINESIEQTFKNILKTDTKDFFIGYSISTNEENIISCGTFFMDDHFHGISFREILDNPNYNQKFRAETDEKYIKRSVRYTLQIRHVEKDEFKADPETAIIFYFRRKADVVNDYERINVANLGLCVDFTGRPLYWLGNKAYEESLDFLFNRYEENHFGESKEDLLTPIAIHRKSKRVTPFLIDIAKNETDSELREESMYWLGYQNNLDALNTLKEIIYSTDEFEDVQEKAVTGLAQIENPEAFEELVKIARLHENREVREEAVIWIGEIASDKAEKELKEIIEDDPDIEMKKHALYALADSDNDMIPYIINIAKTHRNLTLKKTAIYLLGDSEDSRALDALIELAKN